MFEQEERSHGKGAENTQESGHRGHVEARDGSHVSCPKEGEVDEHQLKEKVKVTTQEDTIKPKRGEKYKEEGGADVIDSHLPAEFLCSLTAALRRFREFD